MEYTDIDLPQDLRTRIDNASKRLGIKRAQFLRLAASEKLEAMKM